MTAGAFALDKPADRTGGSGVVHHWTSPEIAAFVFTATAAIAIVLFFHNRFWWAPDEGAFAYIAERLSSGDVLHRDIQDVHGGYIHFVNAIALDWFGRDFLSLRYPLGFLTVAQSCLVFWLLRPNLGAAAAVAGIAMAALTFVQFINPTPNWYALFLTVVVAAVLARRVRRDVTTLATVGLLIGVLFLFRQLSGVFVAIGAVAYLLIDEPSDRDDNSPLVARILSIAMAAGLAAYLWLKSDLLAFVLYGACPLAVLVGVAMRTRVGNRRTMSLMLALAAGAGVAALPLFLYHLASGSLRAWWHDAVISAVSLTGLDFFGGASFGRLIVLAVKGITSLEPTVMANGLFWIIILLAPLTVAVAVLRSVWRGQASHALPFIAVFYGLVAVHFAIPIYALYPAGLALAALVVVAPAGGIARRPAAIAATAFAIVIGLAYQAGQPLTRGLAGIARGDRIALSAEGPPGAAIRIDQADRATYEALLAFIDEHAAPGAPILSLPMSPELYFLSGRPAALRYPIAPLGLRTDGDVAEAWRQLEKATPSVVIFRSDDKYATPAVRRLMGLIELHYQNCREIGAYELFAPTCRT